MKKIYYAMWITSIFLLWTYIVFAWYSKPIWKIDWKCHNTDLKSFYNCSESDFFDQRIEELIKRSSLKQESKDYLIKDSQNSKDISIYNEWEYKKENYLRDLENLITYQSWDIIDELWKLITNWTVNADYYNNTFLPRYNKYAEDFIKYIWKQDKKMFETNIFLEEFDSPLPMMKEEVKNELKIAYNQKITDELRKVLDNWDISEKTFNLLSSKYYESFYWQNSNQIEPKEIYENTFKEIEELKRNILQINIKKDQNKLKPFLPKDLDIRLKKSLFNLPDDKKEYILMKVLTKIDSNIKIIQDKNKTEEIKNVEILLWIREIVKKELERFIK